MKALEIFMPMDHRQALWRGLQMPNRVTGAALFADISGFTPLTSALAQELGRKRGAEEVLRQLNPVYDALIAELHQYGGSVIGFAGDAITCWFDETFLLPAAWQGLAYQRAVACALAMQKAMLAFATVYTPGGTAVNLSIKVAVAGGTARRFTVGDPKIQRMDALAGKTLERMAAAEHQAETGDVVLSEEVAVALADLVEIASWREADGERFAVVGRLREAVAATPWPAVPAAALPVAEVASWALQPVFERLQSGSDFLGELRPVTALFLRFGGIDYDQDENAGEKLDGYLTWIQRIIDGLEGSLIQLTIGDKGSFVYAAFGALRAHADDASRAVAAAVALRDIPEQFAFVGAVQIGISQGLVWTGACGAQVRSTFGAMGDQVNMSARLMGKAKPGQILVHHRIQQIAADTYKFNSLGTVMVKGRAEPLPVAEVVGARAVSAQALLDYYKSPLVGRELELGRLREAGALVAEGRGQLMRLEAPMGVGKSHLTAVFSQQVQTSGWKVAAGLCQGISRDTLYYPWAQIIRHLLDLPLEPVVGQSLAEFMADQVEFVMNLQPAEGDWSLRWPLLGDLLTLPLPDNEVTATFTPQLRQESLQALIVDMIQQMANKQPLLIVIEDIHWQDEMSHQLTLGLARAISHIPLMLVVTHRPNSENKAPIAPELTDFAYHHHIVLPSLEMNTLQSLINPQLPGDVAPLVISLLDRLAHGNPFFTKELVDALLEKGDIIYREERARWEMNDEVVTRLQNTNSLKRENDAWVLAPQAALTAGALNLPDSVQSTILSRVDHLPEMDKLVLKVASVIGRQFHIEVLGQAHPNQLKETQLQEVLGLLVGKEFLYKESDLFLIFIHSATQEVLYDTLLFSQRRDLHETVALAYEQKFGDGAETLELDSPLAPYFSLLAYHWQHAGNVVQERRYVTIAGEQARGQYANYEAERYFSRALALTAAADAAERVRLLLAREQLYDWMGQREAQVADIEQLEQLAEEIGEPALRAQVALRRAHYERATNDVEMGVAAVQRAIAEAGVVGDKVAEAQAHLIWGRLLRSQGAFEDALTHLETAIELARQENEMSVVADSLLDMGTCNMYVGNRESAIDSFQKAYEIFKENNNRKGEAGALTSLGSINIYIGDYVEAKTLLMRALQVCRSIGFRHGETVVLGNLGVVYEELGQYDLGVKCQQEAQIVCEEVGDVEGQGIAFSNLALVHANLGEYEAARRYGQEALRLSRQVGDQHTEGCALAYLGHTWLGLGLWAEAEQAYREAVALRERIGQNEMAMDGVAGLAAAAQGVGDFASAQAHIAALLAWSQTEDGDLDKLEHPLRAYLTIYQVLQAGDDGEQQTEARAYLQKAYELLQERANKLGDVADRERFLGEVLINRSIVALWEGEMVG
ncbi:MAG TPA: tetratricopeptide repeat protein [Anaerolineae bacterium]|nr:tetratricopeptide repeat protein [Anaerolineae bacterium]